MKKLFKIGCLAGLLIVALLSCIGWFSLHSITSKPASSANVVLIPTQASTVASETPTATPTPTMVPATPTPNATATAVALANAQLLAVQGYQSYVLEKVDAFNSAGNTPISTAQFMIGVKSSPACWGLPIEQALQLCNVQSFTGTGISVWLLVLPDGNYGIVFAQGVTPATATVASDFGLDASQVDLTNALQLQQSHYPVPSTTGVKQFQFVLA